MVAYGASVKRRRYHRDGKRVSAAGVSASIDAALFLAGLPGGETLARTIQFGIEYYPQPPFGNGTPDRQPQALTDVIGKVEQARAQRLAARQRAF